MDKLETIIAYKRSEIEKQRSVIPVAELKESQFFNRDTFSLKEFLRDTSKTGIIAEFKRRSPSKGMINAAADVVKITKAYTIYGATGLSVLTDEHFFGGSTADLVQARVNPIPVLRKDFIIDEYQVVESRAIGADAILLIAACLDPKLVKRLAGIAKDIGLEVLLELHEENELGHFCDEMDLVGINNRNLKTFEVDINTSFRLIGKIPANIPVIAESGINSIETVVTLKEAGFKGFLIGENFMKESDPGQAFGIFVTELNKARDEY